MCGKCIVNIHNNQWILSISIHLENLSITQLEYRSPMNIPL